MGLRGMFDISLINQESIGAGYFRLFLRVGMECVLFTSQ